MYPSITQRTEEYENKIKYYNDTAVYKIRQSQHKQSLVFLKEAEKILEFTIQNNCKIDIAYIIAVLQNSACAYSKLFQLEPVQSYLTLLITNLQNYIQQTTTYPITGKVLYFVASTKQKQNIQNFIIRYFMLVQYYVQYVVVCSQLSQNQSNLNVIKKCLFIIKEICEKIMQLEIVSSGFDIRERCQDGKILEYLIGISDVYEVLEAEEEQS